VRLMHDPLQAHRLLPAADNVGCLAPKAAQAWAVTCNMILPLTRTLPAEHTLHVTRPAPVHSKHTPSRCMLRIMSPLASAAAAAAAALTVSSTVSSRFAAAGRNA